MLFKQGYQNSYKQEQGPLETYPITLPKTDQAVFVLPVDKGLTVLCFIKCIHIRGVIRK